MMSHWFLEITNTKVFLNDRGYNNTHFYVKTDIPLKAVKKQSYVLQKQHERYQKYLESQKEDSSDDDIEFVGQPEPG